MDEFIADPAKGFWLLPSRKRPHNLKRIFASMMEAKIETAGLVLIQKDDLDGLKTQYDTVILPPRWQIIETAGESQGDKLRETVDLYKDSDWIGLIGDDQVIKTEHWDLKLISCVRGWNVVSCADNWIVNAPTKHWGNGRFCGSPVFSGELFRTLGWIFLPGIHHVYVDDVVEELGSMTGFWYRNLDVVVDHIHFQNGLAEKDETYSRAYDHYCPGDTQRWNDWRNSGDAKRDAEKIKTLMRRFGQ